MKEQQERCRKQKRQQIREEGGKIPLGQQGTGTHPEGKPCKQALEMGDHPRKGEEKKPMTHEDGTDGKRGGTSTQKRGEDEEEKKGDKTP